MLFKLICSGRSKQYMLFVYSKQTRLYMEEGVTRDSDHRHHHSSVQHCQPTCLLEFDQGFSSQRTHLAVQYIMRLTKDQRVDAFGGYCSVHGIPCCGSAGGERSAMIGEVPLLSLVPYEPPQHAGHCLVGERSAYLWTKPLEGLDTPHFKHARLCSGKSTASGAGAGREKSGSEHCLPY